MVGLGSAPYRDLDAVPDTGKLAFAGLMAPQAKSASRLRSLLSGLFGAKVEIDQFVGLRLKFDAEDRTRLGQKNSGLGVDILVGGSVFSVQDKIRIRIFTKNMAEYRSFLPTGAQCSQLADAVFFYLGEQLDWDVELALPAGAVEPVRLGKAGQLGWTSWMAPNWAAADQTWRCDARFHRGGAAGPRAQARLLSLAMGNDDGRHQPRGGNRQAQQDRLRGLHPGAAPGQGRRQPQRRAGALARSISCRRSAPTSP